MTGARVGDTDNGHAAGSPRKLALLSHSLQVGGAWWLCWPMSLRRSLA